MNTAVVMEPSSADRDLASGDRDLKHRILDFLQGRHCPAERRVTVQVDGGVVTLRGIVRSFYTRQVILNCCQRVPGVTAIVDEVRVEARA